jgi:hypothetical protein
MHDHDQLAAGAASGRAEATGNVIEADFGALHLLIVTIEPRPLIDGADE